MKCCDLQSLSYESYRSGLSRGYFRFNKIIQNYVDGKSEYDFSNDLMLQDAVIRRFEIIGEASSKLSEQVRKLNPNVQWPLIKAMRNKLIHEYFGVSPATIYATIQIDLPALKAQLANLIL